MVRVIQEADLIDRSKKQLQIHHELAPRKKIGVTKMRLKFSALLRAKDNAQPFGYFELIADILRTEMNWTVPIRDNSFLR
jgi:hypothetical protein